MKTRIESEVACVQSLGDADGLDVSLHASTRTMTAKANYYGPAEDRDGPYICTTVSVPHSEDSIEATEVHLFLTVGQTAAIVSAMAGALAKHVDADGHPIPYHVGE